MPDKSETFFYGYMYFLMGGGLQILILNPDSWGSEDDESWGKRRESREHV